MGKTCFWSRSAFCAIFLSIISCLLAKNVWISAQAQTCGSDYTIKENETLRDIAQRAYNDPQKWSIIFYANGDRLGQNTSLLVPGLSIRIPCLDKNQNTAAPAATPDVPASSKASNFELSSMLRRIEFLTADGYEPFVGRSLANGGMLTDALSASMNLIKDQAKGSFDYGISWVNDWSAHLNPLLISRAFDAGYPWTKPDCSNLPELDSESKYRCQKFFFSDPLNEVLTLLFVRKSAPISSAVEDYVLQKKLCQPSGTSVYDLDKGGRNWLKDNKITLMRPPSMEECFRWLDNNVVDVVVAPELVGRAQLIALGMSDRIKTVERPLAVTTLHAIISKTHPHARTILYYINASIAKLRESNEYDRIVEGHLTLFWGDQEKKASPSHSADKLKLPVPEKPSAPNSETIKDNLKKGIARKETPN